MKHYTLHWNRFHLELGHRTAIMGIVNITPDSFSDGGQFYSTEAAVSQAERLVQAGADIVDIGGESTRPYSEGVSAQAEIDRVMPVIERLTTRIGVPISIDTNKAAVAEAALAAGAAIVNDISALQMDDQMAAVAVKYDVPVILMHMKGRPRTMQIDPVYDDLLGEVKAYLKTAIGRARQAGIASDKIIIDPGIGFGKTVAHNLQIIRRLSVFEELDVPILIGTSRKAFIRKILSGATATELSADRPEVETGTQATIAMAVNNGAHIVRVHNVANTKAMVTMLDAIRNA
ncbi:dihydropteroate synthase [Desulfatitalea tepidiphila]|uniref:dihydropteroate synthase n=1 Tax=Desulfatitalea tepidiphila TaxID=1185843 RepID=UPI0006B5EF3C|nr:dihydropteroate synthase [Desulfatitalea tepidiphila]